TQVGLMRLHGGLGAVVVAGIGITAVGVLLSYVAWAVVLWTTVMGVGTLLFGVPLLRREARASSLRQGAHLRPAGGVDRGLGRRGSLRERRYFGLQ
ncbi:MAG: hypothetical protein ACRDV9_00045, partial [Acidimicrobiia bacterium]